MAIDNKKQTSYIGIELLESFTDKELNGLQKIVSCTYFNTDRYVIKLLKVLIKSILKKTDMNDVMLSRVYNQVFDDLPSVKTQLNKKQKALFNAKMSALTRLSERFLRIEALEKSNMHQYDLTLNALLDKKQYRLFNKNLIKAERLAKEEQKKSNRFEFQCKVETNRFRVLWETGSWIKNDNINQVVKILDMDYLTKRMDWTINALQFRTRKPKKDYDLSVVYLKDNKIFAGYFNEDYPYLTLQMASIQLSLYQTDKAYQQYIELLEQNEASISLDELKGYYTIALNFCTRIAKKGKVRYYKKNVELYKILDQKKLITTRNTLSLQSLKNIVLGGCKAGNFEWTLKMIEKYSSNIDKKYRNDVEKFNLGYVAFQQGNYEDAINHLLDVNNFQKSYDRDKRILILKSYYEIEKHYTEPTAQLFRSFELFVSNQNQYTAVDIKSYKNTIRIFYNLYRYKHGVGKMSLDTLKEKVEQAEYINSKAWLLEKIEELREKKSN